MLLESTTEEVNTEVSLNSVIGLSNPKTMKLRGLIGNSEVVVMVDPGATHNFLSLGLVEFAEIPITGSGSFGVSLGNGDAIKGTSICKSVCLQLDGGVELEDFLPLELGSSDVILGVQWLEKLGMVMTNWKTQIMKFEWEGELCTLKGDSTLVRSKVSLKAMLRMLKKKEQGFWVENNRLEKNSPEQASLAEASTGVPGFLKAVINQHLPVFGTATGLPPRRNHEHAIIMKEGSNPVSVRPYRYLQSQKDEIEINCRDACSGDH